MKRTISIIVFIFLVCEIIMADWEQIDFPGNNSLSSVISLGNLLYATASIVYQSQDGGVSWEPIENGWTAIDSQTQNNCCAVSIGNNKENIFVGTSIGLILKYDSNKTWTEIYSQGPVENQRDLENILSIRAKNDTIIVGKITQRGSSGGFCRTFNGGNDWDCNSSFRTGSVFFGNSVFLAGTDGDDVYYSQDFGGTWNKSSGITGYFGDFISMNAIIFGATYDGVFSSKDNGESWTHLGDQSILHDVRALAIHKDLLFAGGGSGIYATKDSGITWVDISEGLNTFQLITSLTVHNSFLYASVDKNLWRRDINEYITKLFVLKHKQAVFKILKTKNTVSKTIIQFYSNLNYIQSLAFYNLNGTKIIETNNLEAIHNDQYAIEIPSLQNNTYFVLIKTKDQNKVVKLLLSYDY